MDILVGTPGRLAEFIHDGELSLEASKYIVLDEVDVLLGDATLFTEQVMTLPFSPYLSLSSRPLLVFRSLKCYF